MDHCSLKISCSLKLNGPNYRGLQFEKKKVIFLFYPYPESVDHCRVWTGEPLSTFYEQLSERSPVSLVFGRLSSFAENHVAVSMWYVAKGSVVCKIKKNYKKILL